METLSDSLNCDKADLWNKSDISEVSEILAHAKLLLLFFTFQFLARNPLRKLAHTFTYWLKACCNTYPRRLGALKSRNHIENFDTKHCIPCKVALEKLSSERVPDLGKEVDIAGGSLFFFLARLRIFCILYKGKGWIKLFSVDFKF